MEVEGSDSFMAHVPVPSQQEVSASVPGQGTVSSRRLFDVITAWNCGASIHEGC